MYSVYIVINHAIIIYFQDDKDLVALISGSPRRLIQSSRLTDGHRTEESLVVEYFNGDEHILVGMMTVAIDKIHSHDPCLHSMGKQMDQDTGDLISFRNEP